MAGGPDMIRHISTRRGLSGFVGSQGLSGCVRVCRGLSGFEIIGQTDIIRHTLTYLDTSGCVGVCRGLSGLSGFVRVCRVFSGFVEPGGYMKPIIIKYMVIIYLAGSTIMLVTCSRRYPMIYELRVEAEGKP